MLVEGKMCIYVPYIPMQLNYKNSSPIVFNKILRKTMKIDFKNSPKMEIFFFETQFWYALLGLYKDAFIIMLTKIYQLYYTLYKRI